MGVQGMVLGCGQVGVEGHWHKAGAIWGHRWDLGVQRGSFAVQQGGFGVPGSLAPGVLGRRLGGPGAGLGRRFLFFTRIRPSRSWGLGRGTPGSSCSTPKVMGAPPLSNPPNPPMYPQIQPNPPNLDGTPPKPSPTPPKSPLHHQILPAPLNPTLPIQPAKHP